MFPRCCIPFEEWAGVANLEDRVDGDAEIDPVVLEALRELAA